MDFLRLARMAFGVAFLTFGTAQMQGAVPVGSFVPGKSDADAVPEQRPFFDSELIFPLEKWHNHGSCIVEAPNGDLIVCWFHGSGERTADDVIIEGARKRRGESRWSARFVMADTPGYPDTNPAMFIDPQDRLWLFWPTILANLWESALMKYKIASDYLGDGPPRWEASEVLHVTPGADFEPDTLKFADDADALLRSLDIPDKVRQETERDLTSMRRSATNKLSRRLGWMTRVHPIVLDNERLIVPLYSDGFSFSLMAITDDWGQTWRTSNPLTGLGNIQPSIVKRKDGSLYTLMRDNGPPPKRLLQSESRDRGETWSPVTDSDLPNPGAGAEIISLRNGNWLLINNDLEEGRHSLAVQISDDEGKTWKWKRRLEFVAPSKTQRGSFHYPSIIQAKDGTLHATYSYFLEVAPEIADGKSDPPRKAIKHAHFNEAWVKRGDSDDVEE